MLVFILTILAHSFHALSYFLQLGKIEKAFNRSTGWLVLLCQAISFSLFIAVGSLKADYVQIVGFEIVLGATCILIFLKIYYCKYIQEFMMFLNQENVYDGEGVEGEGENARPNGEEGDVVIVVEENVGEN